MRRSFTPGSAQLQRESAVGGSTSMSGSKEKDPFLSLASKTGSCTKATKELPKSATTVEST